VLFRAEKIDGEVEMLWRRTFPLVLYENTWFYDSRMWELNNDTANDDLFRLIVSACWNHSWISKYFPNMEYISNQCRTL